MVVASPTRRRRVENNLKIKLASNDRKGYILSMTNAKPAPQTLGVLAGRYVNLDKCLTHSYRAGAKRTLCGGIKAEGLADEYASDADVAPTCPKCAAKDERFKGVA